MDHFDTNSFEQDFEKVDSSLSDVRDSVDFDQEIHATSNDFINSASALIDEFPTDAPTNLPTPTLPDSTSAPSTTMSASIDEVAPVPLSEHLFTSDEQDFKNVGSSLSEEHSSNVDYQEMHATSNDLTNSASALIDEFSSDAPIYLPTPTLPDSTPAPTTTKPASIEDVATIPSSAPLLPSDSLLKNVDPRVIDLIYWRDVKKTGIVFGSALILLLSLAIFSVLSVIAYLSLAALTVTSSFYLYKKVLQIVQKTGEGHPFKQYLEADLKISEANVTDAAEQITTRITESILELRRLFLVGDLIDSFKFALLLWVLTYVGSWFNGMTLFILGLVAIFSIPKFYETNKTQIDEYVNLAKSHLKAAYEQVQQKIPILAKKKSE